MRKTLAAILLVISGSAANAANNPANIPSVPTIAAMQALGAASASIDTAITNNYDAISGSLLTVDGNGLQYGNCPGTRLP